MRRFIPMLLMIGACGHSDAFVGAAPPLADGPFAAGAPIRLTYDPGMDLFPSITPDGSSLLYSYQPAGRADHDRCIAVLPIVGGTRNGFCYEAADGTLRTDALEWPALDASGALLFSHYRSGVGDRIPDGGALRLGTTDAPFAGMTLLTLPNTVGTTGFIRIGQTAWVGPDRFVFVAQDYLMLGNIANGNKKDTTYIGLALIQGVVTSAGATFAVVTGTDSAATFALSAARDSIYFTRYQDHRLYRVPVSGGSRETVYSASVPGPGWVLRNPALVGTRIAVVVARLDQDPQPRGLLAGTRVELIRPGTGDSELLFQSAGGAGVGTIVAPTGSCRIVFEARHAFGISWTTDLESRCAGAAAGCGC